MQNLSISPEISTVKVLLDECVSIRTYKIESLGEYQFYHSIKVVGAGAKDLTVQKAAEKHGFLLVTGDKRFTRLAQNDDLQVAYFNHLNGKVYAWQEIMQLPLTTTGAPVKPVRASVTVKPKLSKWAKFKRALAKLPRINLPNK